MKYGYIESVYEGGYSMISPNILNKISLNTCGFSTFVFRSKQYNLIKRLKSIQEYKVELYDPLNVERRPNIVVELRRDYNLFFARCELIIRPAISNDLSPNKKSSHEVLDSCFQYQVSKKIILSNNTDIKTILNSMFYAQSALTTTAIPATLYQVGRLRLSNNDWLELNRQRELVSLQNDLDRLPSYSPSEFDATLPPNYFDPEVVGVALPRYSTISSLNQRRSIAT